MKIKVEMVIETDASIDYIKKKEIDLKQAVTDAILGYESTGFDSVRFVDCTVSKLLTSLDSFPDKLCELECIESFTAKHINVIGDELVHLEKAFVAGSRYTCFSWRPEGAQVGMDYDGRADCFFVFHKDAKHFAKVGD